MKADLCGPAVMWLLLWCGLFCIGLASSFEINEILEQSVSDFVIDWQDSAETDRHLFQQCVYALLSQQPDNQTLISVKGFIDFANGDIASSVASFRLACDLGGYEEPAVILRLVEVLETNNKFGAVDTLVASLQRRSYSGYAYNIPLIQRLLNTFHATKGEGAFYTHLTQVIRSLPTVYSFWVQYADAHLTATLACLKRATSLSRAMHLGTLPSYTFCTTV